MMLERYSEGENNDGQLYILAFPTNDFHQESGTNEKIKDKIVGLLGENILSNPNFIIFEKSSLRDNEVYRLLQKHIPGKTVKHNFFKYLINKNGIPISFHSKKETLLEMEQEIVKAL